MAGSLVPLGFSIRPITDEEMLACLQRRILIAAGADLHSYPAPPHYHLIPTVDVYAAEPWIVQDGLLAEAAKTGTVAIERDRFIFFTPRKPAVGNGVSRRAGGGSWRSEQKVEIRNSRNELIGTRALFKFYYYCSGDPVGSGNGETGAKNKGKRKTGTELNKKGTEHIMYEYNLNSSSSDFQEITICKMLISGRGGATREECEAAPKKAKVGVHISDGSCSSGTSMATSPSTSRARPDGQKQSVLPLFDEMITQEMMEWEKTLYGIVGLKDMGLGCEYGSSPSAMSSTHLLEHPTATGIPTSGRSDEEKLLWLRSVLEDYDPEPELVSHSSDLCQFTTGTARSGYVSDGAHSMFLSSGITPIIGEQNMASTSFVAMAGETAPGCLASTAPDCSPIFEIPFSSSIEAFPSGSDPTASVSEVASNKGKSLQRSSELGTITAVTTYSAREQGTASTSSCGSVDHSGSAAVDEGSRYVCLVTDQSKASTSSCVRDGEAEYGLFALNTSEWSSSYEIPCSSSNEAFMSESEAEIFLTTGIPTIVITDPPSPSCSAGEQGLTSMFMSGSDANICVTTEIPTIVISDPPSPSCSAGKQGLASMFVSGSDGDACVTTDIPTVVISDPPSPSCSAGEQGLVSVSITPSTRDDLLNNDDSHFSTPLAAANSSAAVADSSTDTAAVWDNEELLKRIADTPMWESDFYDICLQGPPWWYGTSSSLAVCGQWP